VKQPWYYIVRVWLPDRPGALGQVASRIGAVGGDVVGIEIMERGAGMAVDDLVVALPSDDLLDRLRVQIGEVDGAQVEGIRPVESARNDREFDALDIAAALAEPGADVFAVLVARLVEGLRADWAAIVTSAGPTVLSSHGLAPSALWLAGFVEGARHLRFDDGAPPANVVWAGLVRHEAALVMGRDDYPFRWRERGEIERLAAIADCLALAAAESVESGPRA
jgi:hypothetical protein